MTSTYDKTVRLIKWATGEEYGDGETVTSIIVGYAEPGYGDNDSVIVLGNWNPKRWVREGDEPLTPAESLPERLAKALERVGAKIEWSDEWSECQECFRAVRTEQDSYGWKPFYAFVGDGFYCADCLVGMGEAALEDYVNNPEKAITWCDREHLESLGFEQYGRTLANGWYPGQNDNPETVTAEIRREQGDQVKIVFFIDRTGQFDMHFSAYIKRADENNS